MPPKERAPAKKKERSRAPGTALDAQHATEIVRVLGPDAQHSIDESTSTPRINVSSDPGATPRRARGTKATPERRTASVPSVVDVSSADAPSLISVEDGDTDAVGSAPTAKAGTVQRTLDGKVVRSGCADAERRGEVRPSRRPSSGRTKKGANSAATPAPTDPVVSSYIDELVKKHVGYALAARHLRECDATIRQSHFPHSLLRETDHRVADSNLSSLAADSTACRAAGADMAEIRAAVPCLWLFVLEECERAAQRAQTEGEDPLVASLQLLGFFMDMGQAGAEGLYSILFLCCPSCRVHGHTLHSVRHLYLFLLETGRVSAQQLLDWPQEEAMRAVAQALPCGSPNSPPELACPCGEAHCLLASLLAPAVNEGIKDSTEISVFINWWAFLEPVARAAMALYAETKKIRNTYCAVARSSATPQSLGDDFLTGHSAHRKKALKVKLKSPNYEQFTQSVSATALTDALAMIRNAGPGRHRKSPSEGELLANAADFALKRRDGYVKISFSFKLGPTSLVQRSTGRFFQSVIRGENMWMALLTANHTVFCDGEGCSSRSELSEGGHYELLEHHTSFVRRLRSMMTASELLPTWEGEGKTSLEDDASREIDVDAAESSLSCPLLYSHCCADRQQLLNQVTQAMTTQHMVDFAAEQSLESVRAQSASLTSASQRRLIHATLKRHQEEDVQWMSERESSGMTEYAELPLYRRGTNGETGPVRTGTLFYCGSTNETCVLPPESANTSAAYAVLRRIVRGGLLSDDVGLGKTLTLLTLCAQDREHCTRPVPTDSASAASTATFWEVKDGGATPRRGAAASTPLHVSSAVVEKVFGLQPGRPRRGTELPNTTLVVVPLSIAGQWIGEIERFYPSAKYILYYGTRRKQYSAADLSSADFVITTYETIATHLRKEDAGAELLLSRAAACEADFHVPSSLLTCWPGCCPASIMKEVGQLLVSEVTSAPPVTALGGEDTPDGFRFFASEPSVSVTPCSSEEDEEQELQSEGSDATQAQSGRKRGRPVQRSRKPPSGATPKKRKAGNSAEVATTRTCAFKWKETLTEINSVSRAIFRCPVATISAFPSADGSTLPSDRALDAIWDGFLRFATIGDGSRTALFRTDLFHPAVVKALLHGTFDSSASRRRFVAFALLPSISASLKQYWDGVRGQFDPVSGKLCDELMLTDLVFRRVIYDECHKCGSGSKFHLLRGERRWAVSGTPVNNNDPSTLQEPLRAVGADAAARGIAAAEKAYDCAWGTTEVHFSENRRLYVSWSQKRNCAFNHYASVTCGGRLEADCPPDINLSWSCMCPVCCCKLFYGYPAPSDALQLSVAKYPSWFRIFTVNANLHGFSRGISSMFLQTLLSYVVRHQRNDELQRDLSLYPVEHVPEPVTLLADEQFFYVRLATIISSVVARLSREGRLTTRMSVALQWVQTLCRIAIFPALASVSALSAVVADDIYAERGGPEDVDLEDQRKMILQTFISSTAAEVLQWAKEKRARPEVVRGKLVRFPDDTMEAITKLASDPPEFPGCGVCLDTMISPTVLSCYHMFCKECIVSIIENSVSSVTGNTLAKCPYCRSKESMTDVKRVLHLLVTEDAVAKEEVESEERTQSLSQQESAAADAEVAITDETRLARIAGGSRIDRLLHIVRNIWDADAHDGVLVFSKFPQILRHACEAAKNVGLDPLLIDGATTLARRRKIIGSLQPSMPSGAGTEALPERRILFVSSRAANAGLNLTFANHVIFLEPNLNPAVELQAIGRVHRFGQLKRVKAYHLFAPGTIEELIYRRSTRILEQLQTNGSNDLRVESVEHVAPDASNLAARERFAQLGRLQPSETALLLQYPILDLQ